mmetsp:Transcript_3665/g.7448  ORF Transcript_3665/g.7448 Transcript_3665/m.7448 type:complete len:657 (-) Transcript_3665:196-2166(-)
MTTQSLQAKVRRLLAANASMASPAILASLKGVSEFIPSGKNDLAARRQLQHKLEERNLQHCKQLLARFGCVSRMLVDAEETLDNLQRSIEDASTRVQAVRDSTGALVEQASALNHERSILQKKNEVVGSLLQQFQLQPEHVLALESKNGQIGPSFLDALDRVNEIKTNCKHLLEKYQRVGLEIVERLAKRQESAYRKLFHWVQGQIPVVAARSDATTIDPTFKRALNLLKQRPAYFSHCFEMIGDSRRVMLIKAFIAALCRGGPNGTPRPIEIHAGDPLRYVSDMLAWVHQALAMEREFLLSLSSPRIVSLREIKAKKAAEALGGDEKKGGGADGDDGVGSEAQVITAISKVFQGVARPLTVRIEQSLVFQPSPTLTYHLKSVIEFYWRTFRPLVEPKGVFCMALKALVDKAQETFNKLVDAQIKQLSENRVPYTPDLSPPPAIETLLDQTRTLIKVHADCLVAESEKDEAFVPVLDKLVKAILDATASVKGLGESNGAVYSLNTACALDGCLKSPEGGVVRVKARVSAVVKQLIKQLITLQAQAFLNKAGIGEVTKALNGKDVSTAPALEESKLRAALSAFYGYLVGVNTLLTPEMDRLSDPWVRVTVRDGVGVFVKESYGRLHAHVLNPKSGYSPGASSMLKHSPKQIETLLDI